MTILRHSHKLVVTKRQTNAWTIFRGFWTNLCFEKNESFRFNPFQTLTSWKQLKFGAAYLLGVRGWVNRRGGYHKKNCCWNFWNFLSKIYCLTLPKNFEGDSWCCRKFLVSKNFMYKGVASHVSENFLVSTEKHRRGLWYFWDFVFWRCLQIPGLAYKKNKTPMLTSWSEDRCGEKMQKQAPGLFEGSGQTSAF